MTCERCGEEIHPREPGWAQYVEGWEKARLQGGTNAILQPRRHDRYVCKACVVRMQHAPAQEEGLF